MTQRIRLYINTSLVGGEEITINTPQSHYLANVMRVKTGNKICVFNGIDGQWLAEIISVSKKSVVIQTLEQTRPQAPSSDLWLAFAPLKNKTEIVLEKAVELGVSRILPVITRHAVVRSVNVEKLTAHAVEAAEQCERLDVPEITPYKDLSFLLGEWESDRILLYGDESGGGISLPKLLAELPKNTKIGVLIGAEGGFAADEFSMLRVCKFAKPFGMGARILRADTAAISALAYIQADMGNWEEKPHFIKD
jgi:16S rRNA (uracil1498-N3)-methyltransferase